MAKKRMDIVFGEKYGPEDDQKTAWKRCGTLFVDEETGRMSIKLDMIPVGKAFEGWLSVFEPRPRDGGQAAYNAGGGSSPSAEPVIQELDAPNTNINLDDIPF